MAKKDPVLGRIRMFYNSCRIEILGVSVEGEGGLKRDGPPLIYVLCGGGAKYSSVEPDLWEL